MPPLSDSLPAKASLRAQLRARRNAIRADARHKAGRALVTMALRHRLLARGKRLGLYMPSKGEIDILPLLNRALGLGAHCYLPVVPGRGKRRMWFTHFGNKTDWVMNRYGIAENLHPLAVRIRSSRLNTLFLPLLGFDARGYRIGMGGGYYDATLSYLRRARLWRRPRIIGVGFSVQEVDSAPNDAWDIPLDGVLTERGYRSFSRHAQ